MSLKLSRRSTSGHWQITGTVGGRRIRETTGTADRATANKIRSRREAELFRGEIFGPASVKTWKEAALAYAEENPPSDGTKRLLGRLSDHFGNMLLKDVGQEAVTAAARALCEPDAAPGTKLRNVITPARAVLRYAATMKWCDPPALKAPRGASGLKRTRWLTPAEALALVAAAAPHIRPLIVFLYCTGARLREALSLDWEHVDLANARAVLRDVKAKPGDERDRQVDLPPAAIAALSAIQYWVVVDGQAVPTGQRLGKVFRRDDGLPYETLDAEGGGQIKHAWATACRNAGLPGEWKEGPSGHRWWTPKDVTPHVLRHTWASWTYAVTPDLLKLRDVGDWSSVTLVERYTKLVPPGMVPTIKAMWEGGLAHGRHSAAS